MGARILLIAWALTACSVDVSLVGKRCASDGACPDDLVCQAATNTCQEGLSGTPAADWTPAMTAVYHFEPAALTENAVGATLPLTERNAPESTTDAMQGAGAAVIGLDRRAGFDQTDDVFAFAGDFSFGAWLFATTDLSSPNVISRNTMTTGYFLERNEAETAGTCLMDQEPMLGGSPSPDGSWPRDTWVHVVCRYRNTSPTVAITSFVEGAAGDENNGPWAMAPSGTRMSVAPESDVFEGRIDELFFIDAALSAASILRIRACGIDGSLCTCDEASPATYTACGRADDCAPLPPCDQASP